MIDVGAKPPIRHPFLRHRGYLPPITGASLTIDICVSVRDVILSAAPHHGSASWAVRTARGSARARRPDGDFSRYLARQLSSAVWPYRARVTLYASAEAVAAHVWPGFGVPESLDELTCVLGADSVQGWLRSSF